MRYLTGCGLTACGVGVPPRAAVVAFSMKLRPSKITPLSICRLGVCR